jgi:hypothetical protein
MRICKKFAPPVAIPFHGVGDTLALLQQFAERRIIDGFEQTSARSSAQHPIAHGLMQRCRSIPSDPAYFLQLCQSRVFPFDPPPQFLAGFVK